jgi:hypothetical protein
MVVLWLHGVCGSALSMCAALPLNAPVSTARHSFARVFSLPLTHVFGHVIQLTVSRNVPG